GRSLVGFRERTSSFVAALDSCAVLVPEVGQRLQALSDLATSLSIRKRLPQIEVAAGDNALVLILRLLEDPSAEDRERMSAFEREHGVRLLIQRNGPDVLESLDGGPFE